MTEKIRQMFINFFFSKNTLNCKYIPSNLISVSMKLMKA